MFSEDQFKTITWAELEMKEFPANQWRINGLVPRNGITFIAGVSGEKKTWLALHMAYAISTGSHLFGSDKFNVEKGKVLYLDVEMGLREMKRRGNLLKFSQIPADQILIMSEEIVDLRSEYEFECFSEYIEQQGIEVLFIDTLRGVAGGMNEDKAEEVREFLQRFNALKNKGLTIIILDHCRKPVRNEGYAPKKEQLLGSQDKVASAESVLMVRGEAGAPGFAVYQVKSRTGIETKPFMAQMVDQPGGGIAFSYEGEYDEQVSKMDEAKLIIPQVIGTGNLTTKVIVEILRDQHKVGERYVREALRHLVTDNVLITEKLGRENSYKVTELGLLPMDTK